ncbi:uncharacterized protein [Diadema antillarum]|uniref:uncharacterized protein n=1 Tax=Diadema antillarum TaxID=105358 RepID=UPI003A84B33F
MASGSARLCTLVIMMVMTTHCHGNAERNTIITGRYIRDQINPRRLSLQLDAKRLDSLEVSQNCTQDLLDLLAREDSLIPALDAFGKPTPGMLVGNTAWIGHFDECMGITNFKYCLVDLGVNIAIESNSSKALTVNWGVCVPVSCSEADVQNELDILLDFFDWRWMTVDDLSGSPVHCTEKNVTFSAGFIATWVLIGLLFVLSLIGTIADKYLKHKEASEAHLQSKPTSNDLTLDEKSRATLNHYGSTDMMNTSAEGDQGSNIGNGTNEGDGKSDLCANVEDGKEVATLDIVSTSQLPPESAAETTPLMDVSDSENRRRWKEKAAARILRVGFDDISSSEVFTRLFGPFTSKAIANGDLYVDVFFLLRFPKIGLGAITATGIASFITTAAIVWKNNVRLELQSFNDVFPNGNHTSSPGNNGDYYSVVYDKPYCRISPYLLGMMLAYLMQRIGRRELVLNSVVVAGGWTTAVILYMVVIYTNVHNGASSLAASVMYYTFSRFTLAVAIAWVIFSCHYGYGGVVNDFLSWRLWSPLSRLTYSAFLLHQVLQDVYGFGLATPIHWSIYKYAILSAGFISLAYVSAFVMFLLLEFPFINLGKMLLTDVKGARGNGKRNS